MGGQCLVDIETELRVLEKKCTDVFNTILSVPAFSGSLSQLPAIQFGGVLDSPEGVAEINSLVSTLHMGQFDKVGRPYVEHLRFVAGMFSRQDYIRRIIALLHDSFEDVPSFRSEYVNLVGSSNTAYYIYGKIELLTHEIGTSYMGYIQNLARSPVATSVKLADLWHNTRVDRLISASKQYPSKVKLGIRDIERMQKYYSALCCLKHFYYNLPDNLGGTKCLKVR